MAITEAEAKRVFSEGGSILDPRADHLENPIVSIETLPKGFEFGDQVSLDSPAHPKNIEAARKAAGIRALAEDPSADEEYQEFLRFKAAKNRAANRPVAGESEDDEPDEDEDKDAPEITLTPNS